MCNCKSEIDNLPTPQTMVQTTRAENNLFIVKFYFSENILFSYLDELSTTKLNTQVHGRIIRFSIVR